MYLMFTLSASAFFTPAFFAVISVPWSMASVNRKHGMEVFTGFLPASMDTLAGLVRSSRVPLFVPGRPI